MRYSHLFTKTLKHPPHDADSANAKFLTQGGFVHQEMAGVYSWLPLGLRVLRKVERIVREEMDALGAQEVLMTALQPKEHWMKTGRWDNVDVLFKLLSQTDKEYALGCSHEEIATPLVKDFLSSYRDIPVAVYQIQTKFRDELRAKSGVLRGREFAMKDMYSFHLTQEDLEAFYARVIEAYLRVFRRCGTDAKVVEASGGVFSDKRSHEFQILTPAGEDDILACSSCMFAQNIEVATVKPGDKCPQCEGEISASKGVEVGNIFDLGKRYAEPFSVDVALEDGSRQTVRMGCYGLGTTRLVGAIVEACHDERGIIWPKSVAPFQVHLVSLSGKQSDVQQRITQTAEEVYEGCTSAGIEVFWDDRSDVSPGAKFADADLLGIPLRLVISEKTLMESSIEWKDRASEGARLVPLDGLTDVLRAWTVQS